MSEERQLIQDLVAYIQEHAYVDSRVCRVCYFPWPQHSEACPIGELVARAEQVLAPEKVVHTKNMASL